MICFKVTTFLIQFINKNHYWISNELSDVVKDNWLHIIIYIYLRKRGAVDYVCITYLMCGYRLIVHPLSLEN